MPPWRTCPDPDGVDGYAQQSADTADGRESTARVLKNCGFAWMDKSEWKLAIRFFSLSIEKNPGADDTYYGRALAREKIGDKAGAEIDLAMSRSIAR